MADQGHPGQKRFLVFVIAYHAETTLRAVLERIPRSIFSTLDTEVLVVDDASADRTFEIGMEYRDAHPEIRLTVLRNEFNQGYGGNQKVGYAFAIAKGFDYVAMVHGDGQYAPEELPKLLQPLLDDEADAVFGSRMLTRYGALRGGMPLYKFVGNKILTTLQNGLLGSKLSEFHSGYRLYATAALSKLPFALNSNDFHFDTEIIIQFMNAGLRILELPIPTYYGDEISRVNGMKYAKDVMLATTQNALHRAGLLYQRRFDTQIEGNTHYDLKLGYASSHTYALAAVPDGAKVIDIGSGPAGIASELLRKGCKVAVVDQFEPPPSAASELKVHVQDLNAPPKFSVDADYLLLLDVIEHLHSPEQFLAALRKQFDFKTRTLVLTTPNVAFLVQRFMLLLGQFNYGKSGILDRTHTRLFTFRSLERLLVDSGFRLKVVRGVPAPFPKVLGDGLLGRFALQANLALIRLSKTMFSYQIYVVAETTPDVDFVLAAARSSERQSRV
ncbi:MAG TPA: bifunctional glycosyltransferase/class I SAM-dependent methyltransferase [Polyangiales bacterium]|nr:bifunctional glycosyltransferase/class I SAM-dependent methyltransferase [Polyangiales bacterium]